MASVEIQKNVALELRDGEEIKLTIPANTGKFLMLDSVFFIVTNQRVVLTARGLFVNKEKAKSKEETIPFADITQAKHGLAKDISFHLVLKSGIKRRFAMQPHKLDKGVWKRVANNKMDRDDWAAWYKLTGAVVPTVNEGVASSR